MLRAVVTQDSRVKANFADNTVVVLEKSGAAFTVFLPPSNRTQEIQFQGRSQLRGVAGDKADPEPVLQLCEFATSAYASKVAQVLSFRNTYIEEPYFCPLLLSPEVGLQPFQTRYPLPSVHWPRTVAEATSARMLQRAPDGGFVLTCTEEVVRVALSSHRVQVSVVFPLLVQVLPGPVPFYEYVWQSQVFSTADCPARWAPALALLTAAARPTSPPPEQSSSSTQHPSPSAVPVRSPDPCDGGVPAGPDRAPDAHGAGTESAGGGGSGAGREDARGGADGEHVHRSVLPVSTQRTTATWDKVPPNSWWASRSLTHYPLDAVVRVEWTPQAVLRVLPDLEVETLITSNGDAVVSQKHGRFFRHLSATAPVIERVFSNNAVPEWSKCHFSDPVKRSQALQRAARDSKQRLVDAEELRLRGSAAVGAAGTPRGISTEVLEEEDVPGAGKFTAYKDGRVRVAFADRTLLEMDAAGYMCQVLLPNGERQSVRVTMPLGLEPYVSAASEFYRWVLTGPAERHQLIQSHASDERRVLAELDRVQRMMHICQDKLPASAQGSSAKDPKYTQVTKEQAGPATDHVVGSTNSLVEAMLKRNSEMQSTLVAFTGSHGNSSLILKTQNDMKCD